MRNTYRMAAPCLVMLSFLIVDTADAEYESTSHGVEEYGENEPDRLYCGKEHCDDLEYSCNEASATANAFDDIGYAQVKNYHNKGVDGKDWTNKPTKSWGRDHDDPLRFGEGGTKEGVYEFEI